MVKKPMLETETVLSVNGSDVPEVDSAPSFRKSILERMRESQEYMEDLQESPPETSVSMYRPDPTDWFRVHPDTTYRVEAYLVTVRRTKRPDTVGEPISTAI